MKALLLCQYRQLEITDLPRPEPGPDEVLVRVAACGICGSDVHGYDGSSGRRIPPIVMGHEAAGTVAAVGVDVKRLPRMLPADGSEHGQIPAGTEFELDSREALFDRPTDCGQQFIDRIHDAKIGADRHLRTGLAIGKCSQQFVQWLTGRLSP